MPRRKLLLDTSELATQPSVAEQRQQAIAACVSELVRLITEDVTARVLQQQQPQPTASTQTTLRIVTVDGITPFQVHIEQAASLLGVTESDIRRLIKQGKLRTSGSGKLLRVLISSIQSYAEGGAA